MYETVIVPTDGSEAAEAAAQHGIQQAAAHNARLVFLAVVEMSGSAVYGTRDETTIEDQRSARDSEVSALVNDAESAGVESEGVVEVGIPSRVIIEQAAVRDADLLIMATRARSGVGRFLYGSVTERVIRDGDTPVLAVQH